MVARGAGLDPARAGEVRRQHAADRAAAGGPAQQRPVVHRLEGELLAARGDERLDLGNRRPGARREHQLLRLVQRHAGEPGQIKGQIGLRRPADRALGAVADDLQRLALTERPLHGVLDIFGVARFEGVGH